MNQTTKLETEDVGRVALNAGLGSTGEYANLIERMEAETGQRWDSNNGDNAALAGIFGACARALGQSRHNPHDDVAAGVLIRHQMTPEYKRKQQADELMAELLINGFSPDDLKAIIG